MDWSANIRIADDLRARAAERQRPDRCLAVDIREEHKPPLCVSHWLGAVIVEASGTSLYLT